MLDPFEMRSDPIFLLVLYVVDLLGLLRMWGPASMVCPTFLGAHHDYNQYAKNSFDYGVATRGA